MAWSKVPQFISPYSLRRKSVIDEAIRVLGRRFVLQNSNLDGNPEPNRGPHDLDDLTCNPYFVMERRCSNNIDGGLGCANRWKVPTTWGPTSKRKAKS
jgi:hypothetical protein